jgi:hypothetical protein
MAPARCAEELDAEKQKDLKTMKVIYGTMDAPTPNQIHPPWGAAAEEEILLPRVAHKSGRRASDISAAIKLPPMHTSVR